MGPIINSTYTPQGATEKSTKGNTSSRMCSSGGGLAVRVSVVIVALARARTRCVGGPLAVHSRFKEDHIMMNSRSTQYNLNITIAGSPRLERYAPHQFNERQLGETSLALIDRKGYCGSLAPTCANPGKAALQLAPRMSEAYRRASRSERIEILRTWNVPKSKRAAITCPKSD
jgi:hypothetical protein